MAEQGAQSVGLIAQKMADGRMLFLILSSSPQYYTEITLSKHAVVVITWYLVSDYTRKTNY